jgi:hypothetical protein
MKKLNFLQRILAPTPKKEAQRGKLMGFLGTVCAITLTLGVVVNPIGIAALTIGAVATGALALRDASKYLK